MSELAAIAEEYLAIRRSLGFKLHTHARLLRAFVAHLEGVGLNTVTTEAALQWATRPAGASRAWHAQRFTVARVFAAYARTLDPRCEVPPPDVLPYRPRRGQPYLYSADDVAALITEARRLVPRLKAATYQTLVGLLAVTGMRAGEAIRLDRADVDLAAAVVRVVGTKFGKSRELPLHPSTVEALAAYARLRDELCPHPAGPSFLLSAAGSRLVHRSLDETFARLVRGAGLEPNRTSGRRPRPHDLRHAFAVRTLVGWYRGGADVQALLPSLSTYLGHANPASTYWYLSATPELLTLASRRVQQRREGSR